MTNTISEQAVMAALSTVIEPELHRDLVSLNMIRNLKIEGNDVSFTIMLTTPACPSERENGRGFSGCFVSGGGYWQDNG